jgi:hypothetical protein
MMATVLTPGSVHQMTGFCTQALPLRGKSLNELEDLLGYRRGRLAAGATILFLEKLLTPDDIQLAGYSYFSDGAVGGHKLAPADRDPYRMESVLKSEMGWSDAHLRAQKQKMIGTKIVVSGFDRLAKVIPTTGHSAGEEYPPGKGIFQVKVVRPLSFRVKGVIAPGQKWLGDYS